MQVAESCSLAPDRPVIALTRDWGEWDTVSLYLNRCQVDTPDPLVKATWAHVMALRAKVGKVVDFGAGDGRFARHGLYEKYIGYEIDADRCAGASVPLNATLVNRCAFSDEINDAALCIGNPPFVRNQNLPLGWRHHASRVLEQRTGISVSGLANAWQYFFLLSVASAGDDGLCALVIPYEWVSRPSVKTLRDYIAQKRWNVSVYRLIDTTFDSVLTTSSITIIDKAARDGIWSYFSETAGGEYTELPSPSGGIEGVIPYRRRSEIAKGAPRAVRGLSPGTQKVLTLTEGERTRLGLEIERDVVPCVTSLRHVPADSAELDMTAFKKMYRDGGQKCWLIRTDCEHSDALSTYLDSVPVSDRATATCLERGTWWRFSMPPVPDVLMAQSFKGKFPKGVRNTIKARAVGGVAGVFGLSEDQINELVGGLNGIDISDRVVAHSNGLRKIEINQLNGLMLDRFKALNMGNHA
jgi:hypothetical protein